MTVIFAKHEPYGDGHLGRVALDMLHGGAPTIRAVRYGGDLFALEGSHRLALAHHHGIIPKVILFEPDTEGCDAFFDRVCATLPRYEFDHVLMLEEAAFLCR